jgi:ribosomal protein RSM22 (predicted rRNA methylase)
MGSWFMLREHGALARSYSMAVRSRLPYGAYGRVNGTTHGELVDGAKFEPNVRIMTFEETQNVSIEDLSSSAVQRLHPNTLLGKSTGDRLLVLPEPIAEAINRSTVNYNPQKLRTNAARYYLSLAEGGAHRPAQESVDVETHLTGVFLQNYASLHNILTEARRRLGMTWRPNRVLDVGFGPATGIVVLNEVFADAHDWDPDRKLAVIIGHPQMKTQATAILQTQIHEQKLKDESEPDDSNGGTTRTVIRQQMPAYGSSAKYDLIIASHQLYRSGFHYPASVDDHTSHLISLLAPNGVLVLMERGDPSGFESIARARQIMFRPEDTQDVSKTPRPYKGNAQSEQTDFNLRIVAPCAHQGKCPLQVELSRRNQGKDPAFFNWCKFAQMVQRPKFSQELKKGQVLAQKWENDGTDGTAVPKGKGGKSLSGGGRPFGKSYETATHSYIVVQRDGVSDERDSWPRILRPPLKRDKHVIMEVCSPSSNIEHWTVTQGYDKEAYHDARKASGGDLWALGAKVVQQRGGNRSRISKLAKKIDPTKPAAIKPEGDEAIDLAWLKSAEYKSEKIRRKQTLTRGADPSPYEDVSNELDEYFTALTVSDSKKSRQGDAKLHTSQHVEKKGTMKW